uniref:Uncharacterized protein n=1 Tax=Globodera rostochiensis TaxID=31243 RepID=A0A914I3C0_GLORO
MRSFVSILSKKKRFGAQADSNRMQPHNWQGGPCKGLLGACPRWGRIETHSDRNVVQTGPGWCLPPIRSERCSKPGPPGAASRLSQQKADAVAGNGAGEQIACEGPSMGALI